MNELEMFKEPILPKLRVAEVSTCPLIQFFNVDCMEFMRSKPDKCYDLAIVDPMYDLETNYLCPGSKISTTGVKRNHIETARKLSKLEIVSSEYFNELRRISKEQIIWGENYFNYDEKPKGRIIWDKINDTSTFSNAEIASCTLFKGVRIFRYMWNGMLQQNMKNKEIRIHPFQKPVDLYRWILTKFCKHGWKIIDTHGGSMTNAIACDLEGFDLDICEIDPQHFSSGVKAFEIYKSQQRLF